MLSPLRAKLLPLGGLEKRAKEFEIELPPHRVKAFVGYNATLKSLTAKALLLGFLSVGRQILPHLEDRLKHISQLFRVEILQAPQAEEALACLVDDYRLILRAYLSEIEESIRGLEGLLTGEREKGREAFELEVMRLRRQIAPLL